MKLSQTDIDRCKKIGTQRNNNHANTGNFADTSEGVHITGVKGELAVAQKYDLKIDTEDRPHGDEYDFRAVWGNIPVTIDVKSTTYTNDPWLKVPPGEINADVYILAAINNCEVTLVGYATDYMVSNAAITNKTGHMENHILEPDELRELPAPNQVAKL